MRSIAWGIYWFIATLVMLAFIVAMTPFRLWIEDADPRQYP